MTQIAKQCSLFLRLVQLPGLFHKILMPALGIKARTRALGGFELVFVHQQCGQIRPLAADEGFYRVNPAAVILQKDTDAVFDAQAGSQGGGLQAAAAEFIFVHLQKSGNGCNFPGSDEDAPPPGAAVAALSALEYWISGHGFIASSLSRSTNLKMSGVYRGASAVYF
jgi:hypothetical protein